MLRKTSLSLPPQRHVKGNLFADYVRMIRSHKSIDWERHLATEDLELLKQRIDPRAWYPMESFERMGNAILREIANENLLSVRAWGKLSVEQLRTENPLLVAEGNPAETLMRFRVLRSTFFDFDALEVRALADDHARIVVRYHMQAYAEEAASYQTMGFFEQLLEIAGAREVDAKFLGKSWLGDEETVIALHWEMPQ